MTNVITRYFDDAEQARAAKHELVYRQRVSLRILDLYDSPAGLAKTLTAAHVAPKTAQAYEKRLKTGGAVLLARATYKPLGVARIVREVTAQMGAVALDDLVEEVIVKDERPPSLSVLRDHRHFLTRRRDPDRTNFHMADWPWPLIIRRVPFSDAIFPPHSHMASWPVPLLSKRKPYTGSMIAPHGRMADFPIPLLSDRKPYTGSIIAPHGRMADFPIPLISRRKPFTGTLFPRHQRMANWPFPHLINGKTGTNALMPGGPRMANFPISLISTRKPFTGSIFARHARMANFPISLISRRKPYTGSAIPRHGRMADFPLPLVIKGGAFSFSRMLRLPTLIRR